MRIRSLVIYAAGIIVMSLMVLPQASALAEKQVVARVNGTELSMLELDREIQQIVPSSVFHGGVTATRRDKYWNQALDVLIERELVAQGAPRLGYKVDKNELENRKKEIISGFKSNGEFKKALKDAGYSEKEYYGRIEKSMLYDMVIEGEVTRKGTVTRDEALKFFEANRGDFMRPEARGVRHILVQVDPSATPEQRASLVARAEDLLARIRAGEDFGQVAYNYSDGPYRVKNGDLGIVHKGRLLPEIEKAAWSMKDGELSGVIESLYGYHIIQVYEVRTPEQTTFEQAADQLIKDLSDKKLEKLKSDLISALKANAKIEILERK